MYLLPSPYIGEDLLNYKSLDCFHKFLAGWVRDVLVAEHDEKRILTAMVSQTWLSIVLLWPLPHASILTNNSAGQDLVEKVLLQIR